MEIREALSAVAAGASLSESDAESVFHALLSGTLEEAQIGALLAMLQLRGPTVDELVGAARVMRANVTPVSAPGEPGVRVIDTCGTGGAPKTFNVSTASAIVAAGVTPDPASGVDRVIVAKHGNRSRTGRGSAEVLGALGVNVDARPEVQERCLETAGVCFCFAIHHHPAMRHAAAPRKALGFPTIFNVLGPLTNPAGASRQLIGVYRPELIDLVAGALARLGAERAMVVCSEDGLDELTITAPTTAAHVEDGGVRRERIDPASLGLAPATIDELRAADVEDSARLIRDVLAGKPGPHRDMTVINAAAALVVAGAAPDLARGVALAQEAIDSGRAAVVLGALCEASGAS